MKKVLSILLVSIAVTAVNTQAVTTRSGIDTSAQTAADQAESKGFLGKTWKTIYNNKGKVITGTFAIVGLGLAAWNKTKVSKATVDALAWMKHHKALSISIIGAALVASAAGYASVFHYNYDWESIKHAFFESIEDAKNIPCNAWNKTKDAGNWIKENPYTVTSGVALTTASIVALVDLCRENSAIKNAASAIYNKLISKKVEVEVV